MTFRAGVALRKYLRKMLKVMTGGGEKKMGRGGEVLF